MSIKKYTDFIFRVWLPGTWLYTKKIYTTPTTKTPIIGFTRVRNESLLLQDTLDHMSKFVDGVVLFDDASTDDTISIAQNHPIVVAIVKNRKWKPDDRAWQESSNRYTAYKLCHRYKPEWLFYFDADERFEGKIKEFLQKNVNNEAIHAIRISLLDAYITYDDKEPYNHGELFNFRKKFGPERRDILMIWKNNKKAKYLRSDLREPQGFDEKDKVITNFWCQHYGKALSIQHWEDTCEYYSKNFPKYSDKWEKRKGKAVHSFSDFKKPLYSWKKAKDSSFLM